VLVVLAAAALVVPAASQLSPARAADPAAPWSPNLLSTSTQSFDYGLGTWRALPGTTISFNKFVKYAGKGAMNVVRAATTPGIAIAETGPGTTGYTTAVPGHRYRGSFMVRAAGVARPVAASLTFLDVNEKIIETVQGHYVDDRVAGWDAAKHVAAVAPASARYVALRIGIKGAFPQERHIVDSAYLSTATVSQLNVVGPLHTSGNKIFDATGRQIIFRGFSRAGLEGQTRDDGSTEDLPTTEDISAAQRWGTNMIRLPLGEQKWLPGTCYTDSAYKTKVANAVNLVTSRGMVALLDLHFNQVKPCGLAAQQAMATSPMSLTFWQQVAAIYKDNPLVAFDLYNEPHDVTEALWRNGGTTTFKGNTFTVAGMQQMYNTVRQAGATNLVIVTGPTWGNSPPKNGPISGNNIAYGIHSYSCPQQPPPNCGTKTPQQAYNGTVFLKNWLNFAKTSPVLVTEFGWPNPEDGRYSQSVISYAEAQGWGWVQFTWGDSTVGRFDVLAGNGFLNQTNYQPAPVAMPALIAMPA
jgi:hypothetical protein